MTARIRVLVVDDEPVARAGLAELLGQDGDTTVVGECGDGPAAVEAIRSLEPDLVFLDVQMPEMDGFDVLRAIGPDRMPVVVFVTAFDAYAVRAFDVNAVDYLLKPFDDRRFAEALARAKRAVRQGAVDDMTRRLIDLLAADGSAADDTPGDSFMTRLVVKKAGTRLLVGVEEIDWIEAADYCVKIHTPGRTHVIRESLSHLEQRLDPSRFFRAHRSAIVNLDRVQEIQPTPHGDLTLLLTTGARVRLSRSRRVALEGQLGQTL